MKKVAKFGGSSCASAKQFKKVAEIVKADKTIRYVVVSAPGKRDSKDEKVTDLLYQCYEAASQKGAYQKIFAKIKERYESIIDGLALNVNLDDEFRRIEENFTSGAGRDYAASRGEYLNGILMAAYLGFDFIDPADCILFTKEGNCDFEKTEVLLAEALAEHEHAVIPGFYGACEDGTIKTFSRGGSDITGSLVASAAHVELYENWTDVSGFLIADPRIIADPKGIEVITYRELRELSYMGAGVLHEDAIFPVRKEGIPIHIKNTNRPKDHGTIIVPSTLKKPRYTITGIAGKKGFCSINIEKAMMNTEIGFGRKVLEVFEREGISFEHIPSGIDTLTVYVHQDELEAHEQRVLQGIRRTVDPDLIELESDLALIAVVGRGMKNCRGIAGRIFSALGHAYVNIKMIDQGSSEQNIILGVRNEDFEKAIQALYDMFVLSVENK